MLTNPIFRITSMPQSLKLLKFCNVKVMSMKNPLTWYWTHPVYTGKMEMLIRPDRYILYGKLGIDLFSNSELIYPKMKVRKQPIRVSFVVFGTLGKRSTSIFNKKTQYNKVASVQPEILFYRGTSREWSGIWCAWTCSWENRIFVFLKRKRPSCQIWGCRLVGKCCVIFRRIC